MDLDQSVLLDHYRKLLKNCNLVQNGKHKMLYKKNDNTLFGQPDRLIGDTEILTEDRKLFSHDQIFS